MGDLIYGVRGRVRDCARTGRDGEELVKTAAPGDYLRNRRVVSPATLGNGTGSATTAVGYTAQAFRKAAGVTCGWPT